MSEPMTKQEAMREISCLISEARGYGKQCKEALDEATKLALKHGIAIRLEEQVFGVTDGFGVDDEVIGYNPGEQAWTSSEGGCPIDNYGQYDEVNC